MNTTFPRLLQEHARQRPGEAALREKEYGIWQTMHWAGLYAMVGQIAHGLARDGLQRGEHVLVIGATVIAGLLDSFISGTGLGWLTGIIFVISSIYCAVKVRVSDASVAVIAPPIAYGIAALTVGQLGQSRAGGAIISAFVNGFTTLSDNWFWIIGTTLAALAVVIVRSRR